MLGEIGEIGIKLYFTISRKNTISVILTRVLPVPVVMKGKSIELWGEARERKREEKKEERVREAEMLLIANDMATEGERREVGKN